MAFAWRSRTLLCIASGILDDPEAIILEAMRKKHRGAVDARDELGRLEPREWSAAKRVNTALLKVASPETNTNPSRNAVATCGHSN